MDFGSGNLNSITESPHFNFVPPSESASHTSVNGSEQSTEQFKCMNLSNDTATEKLQNFMTHIVDDHLNKNVSETQSYFVKIENQFCACFQYIFIILKEGYF